jgi:hypothetical protein
MKIIVSLIAVLVMALGASAQYVSGPTPQTALTVSTAFYIPGATLTNIPASLAPVVRAGPNGVGFYVLVAGTNAATSTNATIVVAPVAGSSARVVDNQTYSLSVPQQVGGYDFLTNLVNTTANIGNAPGLQVVSINNTNVLGIWISNITAYAR